MKVLVACEFSGAARDAFRAAGHEAWSCDLEGPEGKWTDYHLVGDCRLFLNGQWDLMVAFPPCTHLAVSGARWFKDKRREQAEAISFVRELMSAGIPKIAIENPVGIISTAIRKPDQIIQPWQFGHGETKATCLWLKGLPRLEPTEVVHGRVPRVHFCPPGPDRWKQRSRLLPGIAAAMAAQWGTHG